MSLVKGIGHTTSAKKSWTTDDTRGTPPRPQPQDMHDEMSSTTAAAAAAEGRSNPHHIVTGNANKSVPRNVNATQLADVGVIINRARSITPR